MSVPNFEFASFDTAAFVRDSWQKKSTLIRNPWISWTNPLDPDDLAGLACECEVESRLIEQIDGTLVLEHGPLLPGRFAALGDTPWTLLVQAVDHHVSAVAALREPFGFLPEWRIDDVMVSYASDGGGVGAHFDQYDVFLVQGLGQRKWQVGGRCDEASVLLPHEDLRLLGDFEALEEWILGPGDMLYVPPGIAHHGVAVGDGCMTYSVGFRAPSRRELIAGWSDRILAELDEDDRYRDPDPLADESRGEIGGETLARLQAMIAETLLDRDTFARWFGGFTTQPRSADIDWRPVRPVAPEQARELLHAGTALLRNPAVRFVLIRNGSQALDLFADGERFACPGEVGGFAELCCAHTRIVVSQAMAASLPVMALVVDLVNMGALAFDTA